MPWRLALREGTKKIEGTKTIVDTYNRFRVVTDVAYDDFMQLERPLGVERVPSCHVFSNLIRILSVTKCLH